MSNELITNEEQELTVGSFEIKDFEKQKEWLIQNLKLYNLPEVNEDTYPIAKANRALLNKVSKDLNTRRLNAQKTYMIPFNKGKDQYDELISMIDEVSNKLKEGIDQIDERGKEEKKKELEQYFNSANPYPISFESVMNEKWLNKSTKIEDIKKEIDELFLKINNNLYLVSQNLKDPTLFKWFCHFYFKKLDMEGSLNELSEYMKNEKEYEKVMEAFLK